MIKVSGGARDSEGAKAGLAYIDRQGQLPVEIDDGVVLQGRGVGDHLVADWQLDLCRSQYRRVPGEGETDTRDKLVHNLVLSMPAGTPGDAVLDAARGFARQNFAARYRYAMVLHTDQDHPHVHLVVKCEHETEGGQRLNIRKATLREWREQFAALMRDQGVEANATPRQVRGQEKGTRSSAVHHLLLADRAGSEVTSEVRPAPTTPDGEGAPARGPGAATSVRRKVLAVARELQAGRLSPEEGKATLWATRRQVEAGWAATAEVLRRQGQEALADEVERFTRAMAPVRTDRERIAAGLLEALRAQRTSERERDPQDRVQERSR